MILNEWDFEFDSNSEGAAVFSVWEYALGEYLHEAKISSSKIRMSITTGSPSMSFLMKCIKEWAALHRENQERTTKEYCLLTKLGSKNDCLDFMAYTLIKGMETIEALKGPNKQTDN